MPDNSGPTNGKDYLREKAATLRVRADVHEALANMVPEKLTDDDEDAIWRISCLLPA